MEKFKCIAPEETFFIYKDDSGAYCCPVCGEPGFKLHPYYDDGSASFEMCSCGFEFGSDNSPLASKEAVEGIKENWKRWRAEVIEKAATNSATLKKLTNHTPEYRMRSGNYRVLFEIEGERIVVYRVLHRKEAYS